MRAGCAIPENLACNSVWTHLRRFVYRRSLPLELPRARLNRLQILPALTDRGLVYQFAVTWDDDLRIECVEPVQRAEPGRKLE